MKFRDLRSLLKEFGIVWDESRGKGSHGAFVGLSKKTRTRQTYPIPKSQQREISMAYIKPLRRRFELTKEDGVPDEWFT